ncbi:MAG: hypothetical protein WDO13_02755 [Verrucomicrobiota bacterium]
MLAAGRDPKAYRDLALSGWSEWNARFANTAVMAKLTRILEQADEAGRAQV